MTYFVYMVRCNDDSLYTGMSSDVEKRFIAHSKGRGAKYVKTRLPIRLVFKELVGDQIGLALRREREIKALKRCQKEQLILSQCNLLRLGV